MLLKNRRQFLRKTATTVGLFSLASVPILKAGNKKSSEGDFKHVVYFWLKQPLSKENDQKFLRNLKVFIDGVDVINTKYIGKPADTKRPVIDNTYNYCLNLGFNSKKEHDVYQEHPLHKKFIEDSQDLWERVIVYDSVPV
ncbi:MAG: Dabb family protein [Bacteroidetes bacterium]|nr:MAG: Dabb family protein [Bacteroidota bacterium]